MKIKATMEELSKKLEPRFCSTCKYAKKTAWYALPFIFNRLEFAKCKHPSARIQKNTDYLIDGIDRTESHYCATERMYGCGKEGKNWEPKP